MELYSRNKINQKNTWSLKLIDFLSDIAHDVEVTEPKDKFQVLSSTLDASVKIYSSRVDSVHLDTYKMLGGLSRAKDTPVHEEAEDQEEGDAEKPEGAPKRKAKEGHTHTLETNVANLNIRKLDLQFSIDPLFRKASASFDDQGGRALLLSQLSVYNGCEIIFDSSDALNFDADRLGDSAEIDVLPLQEDLAKICTDLSKLQICPKYMKFQFSDKAQDLERIEDFEDEEECAEWEAIDAVDIQEQERELQNELHAEELPELSNFDTTSQFMDESQPWQDGYVLDDFTQPEIQQNINRVLQIGEGNINSDYTYFNERMMKNWAGPAHWKFKTAPKGTSIPKTTQQDDEEGGKAKASTRTKATKRKAPFLIDFTSPSKREKKEIQKLLEPGDSKTTLSDAMIQKQNSKAKDLLLPADMSFDPAEFTKLFNQPQWGVTSWAERNTWESQPQNTSWNDNFRGDVGDDDDDDMAQFAFPEDGADDHDHGGFLDIEVPSGPLKLVDKPAAAEKIVVKYAQKATFVDVKALKSKMWKELCTEEETHKVQDKPPSEKSFQGMIQAMPERTPAPISVPYYFICLLHLANENNLDITPEGNDLVIKANAMSV
eukprot:TRINITY_DN9893_c0_g1_i1.p1 TRINITY_DN9893_c0_g1~~TRINITY_DN9893_c0_g1_i1.p1  ORF type:complete len:681 (-),score=144.49 TRINITY_DN9893_c0_g1_i1:28-1833(-)